MMIMENILVQLIFSSVPEKPGFSIQNSAPAQKRMALAGPSQYPAIISSQALSEMYPGQHIFSGVPEIPGSNMQKSPPWTVKRMTILGYPFRYPVIMPLWVIPDILTTLTETDMPICTGLMIPWPPEASAPRVIFPEPI
jgi:hypothetical protein